MRHRTAIAATRAQCSGPSPRGGTVAVLGTAREMRGESPDMRNTLAKAAVTRLLPIKATTSTVVGPAWIRPNSGLKSLGSGPSRLSDADFPAPSQARGALPSVARSRPGGCRFRRARFPAATAVPWASGSRCPSARPPGTGTSTGSHRLSIHQESSATSAITSRGVRISIVW